MNVLKKSLAALALTIVLTAAAVAGDMPTGGFVPPPPPKPTSTSTGDMPTGGLTAEPTDDYVDPLTQVWLSLIGMF